jgi:hypothetical protein
MIGIAVVIGEQAERFEVQLSRYMRNAGCKFLVDRRPDGASPAIGDFVILKYEEGDQFATVVYPSEPVAPEGLWSEEHGTCYQVPAAVLAAGLKDCSWHNDISPSFCWPEDEDKQELRLWVEYPVAELREGGVEKRYLVQYWPDRVHELPDEQTHFHTDSLTEALGKMAEWGHLVGHPSKTIEAPEVLVKAWNTLKQIQSAMDGLEWSPDTLETIAGIMRAGGYEIRDVQTAAAEQEDGHEG